MHLFSHSSHHYYSLFKPPLVYPWTQCNLQGSAESRRMVVTGNDQLAQMVLSVSLSPRWGISFFFPGYQLPLRPNMEMIIKRAGWQLEEYEWFHADSYSVQLEQLDVLEILPLLEHGEWIGEERDGGQGGKSRF